MDEDNKLIYHCHDDGVYHCHSVDDGGATPHEHEHGHEHPHTHTQTKAVLNRLSKSIGHLESVKRMVEDGRDCSEVLVQLAAVRASLNATAKVIMKDHIEHCLTDDSAENAEVLRALNDAIDKFI